MMGIRLVPQSQTDAILEAEMVPKMLKIERRADGQIVAGHGEGAMAPVQARPCFPWTEPSKYISLRDEKGGEVALVEDLGELNPGARALLEEALAGTDFVLEIAQVESCVEEFEIRNWKVQTRQGPYRFQTKLDEYPRPIPSGGMVVRAVDGNLFRIPPPDALDDQSRKILWVFLD